MRFSNFRKGYVFVSLGMRCTIIIVYVAEIGSALVFPVGGSRTLGRTTRPFQSPSPLRLYCLAALSPLARSTPTGYGNDVIQNVLARTHYISTCNVVYIHTHTLTELKNP